MSEEDQVEPEQPDPFKDILARANVKLNEQTNALMDMNHGSIQQIRAAVFMLRGFSQRYEDIMDRMMLTLTVAAKEIADLYGDMILAENGVSEDESEEEEEAEEEGNEEEQP